jgi:hypothetical protein
MPSKDRHAMTTKNIAARFEIAVDGKPTSFRNEKPAAIEGAIYLRPSNHTPR